ncbi:MAG: 5-formyltetrahydrofolate cyclo-ligase [Hyphomicrobiales bacterium]|nr:5-formyltetrahydrofolate cyclo-ligase [Hyphomicrobiales bacterium]
MASKAEIRAAALARRALVPQTVRNAFAERLAGEGLEFARRCGARVASLYAAIRTEADPSLLLAALAGAGLVTALPVTRARGEPLLFRGWRPGEPLVSGPLCLVEPAPHLPECWPDLLFVPLAAFDRSGHRIGYGAGHYDCSLAVLRARQRVLAVGIAFGAQEVAAVPHEPHDQCLDFIVTETEWISCAAGRD